ncbi:MAG: hypothetical protein OER56_13850 [Hyphomicrobiales bacterium]|nr:hypothetical protein [Hyphomicrobiales bacterium]
MKRYLMAMATAALATVAVAMLAEARQNGPHQIIAYNGQEYAFMKLTHGDGTQFKVFRAIGNTSWEYLGSATISDRSGHGRFSKIYFNGRKAGSVSGDLNLPFYQPYNGFGGSDRVN